MRDQINPNRIGYRSKVMHDSINALSCPLPGGINWLNPEDQISSPELSVPVHVYLRTKDEVQILDMDGSDVRNEYFAVCKRVSITLISDNKDLLS